MKFRLALITTILSSLIFTPHAQAFDTILLLTTLSGNESAGSPHLYLAFGCPIIDAENGTVEQAKESTYWEETESFELDPDLPFTSVSPLGGIYFGSFDINAVIQVDSPSDDTCSGGYQLMLMEDRAWWNSDRLVASLPWQEKIAARILKEIETADAEYAKLSDWEQMFKGNPRSRGTILVELAGTNVTAKVEVLWMR